MRIARRPQSRSTSTRPSSRSTANSTSFTDTTAPGTASSTTTGRCTASSRRWMGGKKCSGFYTSTWPNNHPTILRNGMCTSIVEVVGADGAGKGGDGWFDLTHSVVSYDHPHHALLEEAITIDFVNAALGPGARVAVELTLESAKALSGALSRAIEAAEIEESARFRQRR